MLVSGGSEGALLHWDLSLPTPTPTSVPNDTPDTAGISGHVPTYSPRATLSQAHDSNIWSLAFHPLGHLLVTASNDHTTRFWSRERPGDAGSVFSAGGEKPPQIVDMSGQEEDEDTALPGLGFGGVGSGWWGKDEPAPGVDNGTPGLGNGGLGNNMAVDDDIPGFGSSDVPGLGGGSSSGMGGMGPGGPIPPALRQNGANSLQDDSYGDNLPGFGGGGRGRGDDWGQRRGGGGGGNGCGGGRWGGRRGRY